VRPHSGVSNLLMNSRLSATLLVLGLLIIVAVVSAMRHNATRTDRVAVTYRPAPASHVPSPVRNVTATPRPVAPRRSVAASAAPATAPASAVTVAPAPTATPLPPVPRLSPDRAPQIVAVNISSQAVHPGDVVSGTVETSSNVASVEAHLATYAIPMQKVGVGRFTLKYQVPDIPFFFRGKTYAIDIVAHNTRGDSVSASIPVLVR